MPKSKFFKELTVGEQKFLTDMIEHHKMALMMSKDVLRSTEDYDTMSLAYSIIQNQTNEIALMAKMLRSRRWWSVFYVIIYLYVFVYSEDANW